jgi:hypothetical protein
MDLYTIVYTKDSSNNIVPLNYNISTDLISFNIKDLSGAITPGNNGSFEIANLSSSIQIVSQTTSISTPVTLNQPYGIIILYSPFNFSSGYISFTLNNSLFNSNSIILNCAYSTFNGAPDYNIKSNISYVSDGIATVSLFNNNGTTTPVFTTISIPIYIFFRIYTENTPIINV